MGALVSEGQGHLFQGWGAATGEGAADAKRRLVAQLAHLDRSYAGGLVKYIQNARRLLLESKEGAWLGGRGRGVVVAPARGRAARNKRRADAFGRARGALRRLDPPDPPPPHILIPGVNPFEGCVPSVPEGVRLDYGSAEFRRYERSGAAEAAQSAFVLVAGEWVGGRAVGRMACCASR